MGTASSGYYAFYVSSQYYVSLYTAGGYSQFDGTKEEGDVWFYSYLNDYYGNQVGEGGYDEFTWSDRLMTSLRAARKKFLRFSHHNLESVCTLL